MVMKSFMKYNKEDVFVKGTLYMDGTSALVLLSEGGVPIAKATVNLDLVDDLPDDDIVWIKDYAENIGVRKTLHDGGIVESTGVKLTKHFDTHSVMFHQARIIDQDVLNQLKEARERVSK
tara:strand:- start:643 stop:1002 length:360 start_codon:yes stop_codon:yes gene_type:complete